MNVRAAPMSWISYAQNREDVLLNRVFRDQPRGFYIDVGACDPVHLSITKHFYDLGWSGINLEPSPTSYPRVAAGRPRDLNLEVGVSDHAGTMTFFKAEESASGLSTFVAEEVALHEKNGFKFERFERPVMTLAEICRAHVTGPIDFMSIDVEGHELEVLRGADFGRFRPRVLLVEATRPKSTELTHDRWEPLLLGAGYVYATFDGLNRYYVRQEERELAPLLVVPPNVFDDFVPYEYQRQIDELQAEVNVYRARSLLFSSAVRASRWVAGQVKSGVGRIVRR